MLSETKKDRLQKGERREMIRQEEEKNLSKVSKTCKFSAVVAKFNACKLTSYVSSLDTQMQQRRKCLFSMQVHVRCFVQLHNSRQRSLPLLLISTNASKCILLTILCPQDSFKNNSKIQQRTKMLLCLRNWAFSSQLGTFFLQDKEVIFKG